MTSHKDRQKERRQKELRKRKIKKKKKRQTERMIIIVIARQTGKRADKELEWERGGEDGEKGVGGRGEDGERGRKGKGADTDRISSRLVYDLSKRPQSRADVPLINMHFCPSKRMRDYKGQRNPSSQIPLSIYWTHSVRPCRELDYCHLSKEIRLLTKKKKKKKKGGGEGGGGDTPTGRVKCHGFIVACLFFVRLTMIERVSCHQ